jgi:hypothetical protein
MWKHILISAVSAMAFVQAWATEADAQSTWCPPGSTPVPAPSGYGNACRCPDGSLASINGCPQRYTRPQPQPSIPQQPITPATNPQLASVFSFFNSALDGWRSEQNKDMDSRYNLNDIVKQAQKTNSIVAQPPSGFFDKYEPPPNPNVTPANPFGLSKELKDVKGVTPTLPPRTNDTSTTLPPPGQLGVNPGVTGFQPQTNTTQNNQSWGQKATNWIECGVLRRC